MVSLLSWNKESQYEFFYFTGTYFYSKKFIELFFRSNFFCTWREKNAFCHFKVMCWYIYVALVDIYFDQTSVCNIYVAVKRSSLVILKKENELLFLMFLGTFRISRKGGWVALKFAVEGKLSFEGRDMWIGVILLTYVVL